MRNVVKGIVSNRSDGSIIKCLTALFDELKEERHFKK